MPDLGKAEIDKIFCMNSKKYAIPKLILKSIGITESSLMPRAFRHEPGFWDRYLKDNPEWNYRDRAEVSSSYGIMQLMYTTAWTLGFRGSGEDLYDPVVNIELGSRLIRQIVDRVIKDDCTSKFIWLSPLDVALSRYNGGMRGNPDVAGVLRNQKYVDKVHRAWEELKAKKEKECDEV